MSLTFRHATLNDLTTLVELLAADPIGKTREKVQSPPHQNYIKAFEAINNSDNNELIIAERDDQIIGSLQLTFIPYLTHLGSWRCLIEGVRIDERFRGKGYGRQMFLWAIQQAKQKQCSIVQLTSDKQRTDALAFYRSLGFKDTHEGFKLKL